MDATLTITLDGNNTYRPRRPVPGISSLAIAYRVLRGEQGILETTIVLTNMRLAFIGKVKSVVTQLPKVVHVESYNDALAVFQEGRESPNFYKISAPQYFLLYMNWVLDHQA